jgi:signal transduction histidine kinase
MPDLEPEARELYARTILAKARRMGRLAASFLAVAAPPHLDEVDDLDLDAMVDRALREVGDATRLREFQIEWERPGELRLAWPQVVLEQLLVAAVDAALEAARSSAHLTLQARAEGPDLLVFEITGARCEGARAAASFAYRAARRLVEQRGGEVALEAEPGLRLTLRLPRVGHLRDGDTGPDYLGESA